MASMARDPDIADRIKALGPSKVNPEVERAMRGRGGKRPNCPTCGETLDEVHVPHESTFKAEQMDRGVLK